MKKLSLAIALALLLVACASKTTVRYLLQIDAQDPSRILELVNETERVVTRKLAAKAIKAVASAVPKGGQEAELTMYPQNKDDAKKIQAFLNEPFTFELKIEKSADAAQAGASAVSAGLPDWIPTALTGSSIAWLQPVGDRETGGIGVEIQFTPEGRRKFADIVATNKDRTLGIFVKNFLVSKLKIENEKVQDKVIVSGIPSSAVAQVFAEDVNVGLRVRFTPLAAVQ